MRSLCAAAIFFAAILVPPTAQAGCPEVTVWPGADWEVRLPTADPALDRAVEALRRYAFPPRAPDRLGIRTDGVVIARGGLIVFEEYSDGYGPEAPHVAWSCAKTLASALAGVALGEGRLSLDDSICRHVPAPPTHCGVTVRHLLQHASGIDWNEGYERTTFQESSVLSMLYGVGHRDMAAFVLSHGRRAPPGARWSYSSGDSVLVAAVVRAALEPVLGADWPSAALLDPLGMASATLERDRAGTPVGSSLLHATPRDLARLGLLYLADGCWQGRRLLPEGFVAESTSVSGPSRSASALREPGDVYGLGLWLNRPVPELAQGVPWPGVPEDAFAARGHWGQLVTVIPSLGLVVVRTADDHEKGAFDLARFLRLAIDVGGAR